MDTSNNPSFRRVPDKSAKRAERPQGGPEGERSESSMVFSKGWTPAFAGVTRFEPSKVL